MSSGKKKTASQGAQIEFDYDRKGMLDIIDRCQLGDAMAKALLRTLESHIRGKPFWDLAFSEIAVEMNCSISTVRRKVRYLVDRAYIDMDDLNGSRRYRADGVGPLKRFRISWSNLEDTLADVPRAAIELQADRDGGQIDRAELQIDRADGQADRQELQADRAELQIDRLGGQAATLTTYERQRTPPPPKPGDWLGVVEVLKSQGLQQATRAVRAAEMRGLSPGDVLAIVEEWKTRRSDFDDPPAALYARLVDLDALPPPSERAQVRALELRRREAAERETQRLRAEAERAQQRRADAAAYQGPKFEELAPERQAELIEIERERYPQAEMRLLRRFAAANLPKHERR